MKPLKFKPQIDSTRIRAAEWLLGYPVAAPSNWRFGNLNQSQRRLASPLRGFLGVISQFSLDRGIRFDVPQATPEDPRQLFLDSLQEYNDFPRLLETALERGAITGSVYLVMEPYEAAMGKVYGIRVYDETECIHKETEDLEGFQFQVQSDDGYDRWILTDTERLTYRSTEYPGSPWELESQEPHGYSECPVVKIQNRPQDHGNKSDPSFDWVAIELAVEILTQNLAAASNYVYFGSPFLVSPDPEQTSKELHQRKQVLTGSSSPELQALGLLPSSGMPSEHSGFIERLNKSFNEHVGISWLPDVMPGDTSSLTLRLLNARSIATSQRMADVYLGGFSELLEKSLRMAQVDGLGLSGDPEVDFKFLAEIFPPTPTDKLQILSVAEQLISMGVKPEIALKEYFPELDSDEIVGLLQGY